MTCRPKICCCRCTYESCCMFPRNYMLRIYHGFAPASLEVKLVVLVSVRNRNFAENRDRYLERVYVEMSSNNLATEF